MLSLEMGAHPHLVVVQGKMNGAAAELKEQFLFVAVASVLLDGVVHRLLGEPVFQFKGGNGKAVDEDRHVQGEGRFAFAVAERSRHAEDIGCKPFSGLHIARSRSSVEKVDGGRTMFDAAA
ncbi:MAG: hypothetical protein A4E72_01337 [Syntrophus sp. PtaU1.Bin208]|nr:MAG: hypothetical protein A4E72_01337 [Syntrophus sp. PtaU1.Bin208]